MPGICQFRCVPAIVPVVAAFACNLTDHLFHGEDSVATDPVVVEEVFSQAAAPRLDVLWVVDNTASMAEEQVGLAGAFASFVGALDEARVAYQLGVVSTDIQREDAGELLGTPWVITPSTPDASLVFASSVQVGTSGLGPEAGLAAACLALGEPLISSANMGFRRPGATLHIVVVSDADDGSADFFQDDPFTAFMAFAEQEELASGGDVILSALAGDPGTGCTGASGRALPADIYASLAEALGGVFESICTNDMSGVVAALAQSGLVYADTFPLQEPALPETLLISVDDVRVIAGWSYRTDSPAVVFDSAPAPGSIIKVSYTVDESGASS